MSVLGYTRGKFPLTEVIDLPLGYKNGLSATRLINQYFAEISAQGIRGSQSPLFPRPRPRNPPHEKARGQAGGSERAADPFDRTQRRRSLPPWAASPVAMPMGETYDALKRGMADGSMAPIESLEGWKWGEVVKMHHRKLWRRLQHGFFRGHEQGEMELPSAGDPEDHRERSTRSGSRRPGKSGTRSTNRERLSLRNWEIRSSPFPRRKTKDGRRR